MKRSLDIAAIVLTSLLLLGFAVLSLRGLIDPQPASARFGTPVSDAAGALFYRVYLSRNLVIVASGAIFLLSRQWTALAILMTIPRPSAVRHVGAVAERRDAAGISPRRAGAARDHRRAAVAARSHGQDLGAPGG